MPPSRRAPRSPSLLAPLIGPLYFEPAMNLTAMLRFNVPSTTASGRCSGWWVSDAHAGTALPDVCGTSAGEVHLEVRDGEPRYLVPYSTMCGICAQE